MNKKKNLFSALVLQIFTMVSGLILPRIIIGTFGSEINGMVSSITQFLSFISLLEGGLGAVILAELYKPIEVNDHETINSILNSCQNFFKKLSLVFIIYTIIVGVVYSIAAKNKYSFAFVCTLVFILSFATLAQYLFSITNKLLLQAQQKIYIVNIVMAITVIANLLISIVLIYIYPEIHLIKLGSAIAYLLQPIVFNYYVDKKYRGKRRRECNTRYNLKNRWDGFAQNLAHFINLNTDVAVITIFSSLVNVSIYSVYMLSITALRSIVASLTNSYQSALGKYFAQEDFSQLKGKFEKFDNMNTAVSMALFCTCILLINPFVSIYTSGIKDANYYQPLFALIITLANLVYCIREPYRFIILAAGRFKETNFGAMMEAILNLIISISLVRWFGLVGIAIGTLIAVTYRYLYFVYYLKKDILYKDYTEYIFRWVKISILIVLNVIVYYSVSFGVEGFIDFIIYGMIIFIIEVTISYLLFIKLNKKAIMRGGKNDRKKGLD